MSPVSDNLPRTSCVLVHEDQMADEIARLNSEGWYITSGRKVGGMSDQFALYAIYTGNFLEQKNLDNNPGWR